jgi:hypothetical protein
MFRHIAANPVGRVLLYRILIEINREGTGAGIAGIDGAPIVIPIDTGLLEVDGAAAATMLLITRNGVNVIARRNNLRSIYIEFCNSYSTPSFFDSGSQCIRIADFPGVCYTTLCINSFGKLTTDYLSNPAHLKLFHEMLHWFHWLRNPQRVVNERSTFVQDFNAIVGFPMAQANAFLIAPPALAPAPAPSLQRNLFMTASDDALNTALLKLLNNPVPQTVALRVTALNALSDEALQNLLRTFVDNVKKSYIFYAYHYTITNDISPWSSYKKSTSCEEIRTIAGSPVPHFLTIYGSIVKGTIYQRMRTGNHLDCTCDGDIQEVR